MPIDKPRSEVSTMMAKWQRCRDVMGGEDRIKHARERYLPRLSDQTDPEYDAYLMRALFYGGTRRTKSALVGLALGKEPQVEFVDTFKDQLEDITLDGTTLKAFVAKALDEVIEVGRFGFLVDMPANPAGVADARPYWVGYEAEAILDWDTVRRGGKRVLTLVVLQECYETRDADLCITTNKQFRVLRLTDPLGANPIYMQTVYRYAATDNKTLVAEPDIVPLRRGVPLDFIPFCFVGPLGILPEIEDPPLEDMACVNLSHYRSSADLEHGRHFTALPTPWVVGAPADGSPLRIGSGVAWELSGNGAQAGMLEFTGQGLGALEKALDQKKEDMAVLGARLVDAQSGTNETAESVRSRQAAAYATLMSITDSVSQAVTIALRWHAWWIGVEKPEAAKPPVGAKINSAFFQARLTADELRSLLLAMQAGELSYETFYWNLVRGDIARPNVDAEAEKKQITSEASWRQENDAILLTGAGAKPNPADAGGGQPQPGAPKPGAPTPPAAPKAAA